MRSRLVALSLLVAAPALAQDAPRRVKLKTYSVTFAPIRLINPILEVEIEYRLTDVISVTAIAAGGKVELDNTTADEKVTTFEVGGQLSYFLLGDFERGLMVSVEGLYVSLDTDQKVGERVGFGIGPLLGYKFAVRSGFTFLAQAGISYVSGEGKLDDNIMCQRCEANLNLNVGWSF